MPAFLQFTCHKDGKHANFFFKLRFLAHVLRLNKHLLLIYTLFVEKIETEVKNLNWKSHGNDTKNDKNI